MHFLYILTAANLYARMHGLPGSQSRPALRELLKGLLESDSTPQNLFSAELGEVPGFIVQLFLPLPRQVLSLCLEGR